MAAWAALCPRRWSQHHILSSSHVYISREKNSAVMWFINLGVNYCLLHQQLLLILLALEEMPVRGGAVRTCERQHNLGGRSPAEALATLLGNTADELVKTLPTPSTWLPPTTKAEHPSTHWLSRALLWLETVMQQDMNEVSLRKERSLC